MRNAAGNPQGTGIAKFLPLGARGYLTAGFQFANDGTAVTGGDASGAWVKGPADTKWTQLYESGRVPSAYCTSMAGVGRVNSSYVGSNPGCYGITIAPSDSSRIYTTCEGDVLKSTNGGATFVKIGGPYKMPSDGGPNGCRNPQRHMIVDPQNPNVMMLGPCEGKIVYWTDGTTPNAITVAAGSTVGGNPANHYVAVDPSSSVVGGVKQTWAYSIEGDGVYLSTTGPGGTYTKITSSPASLNALIFDAAGNLWALQRGGSNNIFKKTSAGSTFSAVSAPSLEWATIAIDPSNTSSIAVADENGNLARSTDGGASWVGSDSFLGAWPPPYGQSVFDTAIKNLSSGRGVKVGSVAELAFHPTNGKLFAATGLGVRWSNPPSTFSEWKWFDDSLGIEELEVSHIMVPSGGKPMVSVRDQGIFKINDENRWSNDHKFPNPAVGFGHGWFTDSAPGTPSFLISACGYQQDAHGYSSNYGDSWTAFSGSHPDAGTVTIVGGGMIAGSTTAFSWFPSNNIRAVETTDGGATWNYLTFTGLPTSGESGWGWSLWNVHQPFCSDKTNGDRYAYNYGPTGNTGIAGVYKKAMGGSWVKMSGNPGGYQSTFLGKMDCVPGQTGHLFWKGDFSTPLMRSIDSGATWTAVANTSAVQCFAFGQAAPGKSYPTIFMYGTLSGVRGLYRSDDNCASWVFLGEYIGNQTGAVQIMAGHPDVYGRVYIGFAHSGGMIVDYNCAVTLT